VFIDTLKSPQILSPQLDSVSI